MWLTIKTIKIRLLQLKNGNGLITILYCSNLFYFVSIECRKNNALLSSVIPHARSLTKIVNFYKNFKEVSSVCKTLAKKYRNNNISYRNNNNLNLNDYKILVVTTAFN